MNISTKMKYIIFILCSLKISKDIRCITIYEEKSFAMRLNEILKLLKPFDNAFRLSRNSYKLLRFTMNVSMKMKYVVFILCSLRTTKELRYITIYKEKSFPMHFNEFAFFQTL